MSWRDVPGWLEEYEAAALQELARDKDVLEIGSYCGRSTLALAETARLVFALDWHLGDADVGSRDTVQDFLTNIAPVRHKVCLLMGRVEDVGPKLAGPFGMVFIDGSHRREQVVHDTKLALRVCDGVIVWHDVGVKGIKMALEELAISPDSYSGRNLAWKVVH